MIARTARRRSPGGPGGPGGFGGFGGFGGADTSLPAHPLASLLVAPAPPSAAEASPAGGPVHDRPPRRPDPQEFCPLGRDPLGTEVGTGRRWSARRLAPRLGWATAYGGRANTVARPRVFRADTAGLPGVYPYLHGGPLPAAGAYLGFDTLTGQAFTAHPAVWVTAGLAANPNLLVTGVPGSGKSANLKALALRLMAFGVKALVAGDVKGEYNPLCQAVGVHPLRLGPGLPGRLNPLDAGPLGVEVAGRSGPAAAAGRAEIHRRRMTLLTALLELVLHRRVEPDEADAVSVAVRQVTGELSAASRLAAPTIPAVYAVLRDPTPAMAHELRVRGDDVQALREQTVKVRAALAALVSGQLGGLFDAETSDPVDLSAPIASVDVSGLASAAEDTIAMVLTCLSSWAQAAVDAPGPPRLVIRDELWRAMRAGGPAMVGKVDADLRLSRNDGAIQALATHRLSDFEAVGAAGSEAVAIARDLVASCAVKVTLAQDAGRCGPSPRRPGSPTPNGR